MNNAKVDNYTKFMLTVIAICLTVLTLEQVDLFPKAYAGESTSPAMISGTKYGLVPLNEDGSITVKISASDELDVNIVGIDTSDELDVNNDELGGSHVSSGGPRPVQIK
ncbi:MAG: hypothetical protein RIB86_08915 [Imperialibacter sp.]